MVCGLILPVRIQQCQGTEVVGKGFAIALESMVLVISSI